MHNNPYNGWVKITNGSEMLEELSCEHPFGVTQNRTFINSTLNTQPKSSRNHPRKTKSTILTGEDVTHKKEKEKNNPTCNSGM